MLNCYHVELEGTFLFPLRLDFVWFGFCILKEIVLQEGTWQIFFYSSRKSLIPSPLSINKKVSIIFTTFLNKQIALLPLGDIARIN